MSSHFPKHVTIIIILCIRKACFRTMLLCHRLILAAYLPVYGAERLKGIIPCPCRFSLKRRDVGKAVPCAVKCGVSYTAIIGTVSVSVRSCCPSVLSHLRPCHPCPVSVPVRTVRPCFFLYTAMRPRRAAYICMFMHFHSFCPFWDNGVFSRRSGILGICINIQDVL